MIHGNLNEKAFKGARDEQRTKPFLARLTATIAGLGCPYPQRSWKNRQWPFPMANRQRKEDGKLKPQDLAVPEIKGRQENEIADYAPEVYFEDRVLRRGLPGAAENAPKEEQECDQAKDADVGQNVQPRVEWRCHN